MDRQKVCENCGKPLSDSDIVCMYCGHSVRKTDVDYSKVIDQLDRGAKKSSITTGRIIAFAVLFMNIVTIVLCINDSALRYVCMFTAVACAAVAVVLVVMSFRVSKKNTPEEVEGTTGAILKGAIGILIFSGIDFIVAVSSTLFSPF